MSEEEERLSSFAPEAAMSANMLTTVESLHYFEQGCLALSVDRTLIPYQNYELWKSLREECASLGIFPQTTKNINHKKLENFWLSQFGKLTQSFVENVILKSKGDFCVWKKIDDTSMLSIKGKKGACFHFRIVNNHNGFFIASTYGVYGETLSELILKLFSSPLNVLTTIAGDKVSMKNFVEPQTFSKYFATYDVIKKEKEVIVTRQNRVYQGFLDTKNAIIFESIHSNANNFDEIFQELLTSVFLTQNVANASSMFYLLNSAQTNSLPFQRIYSKTAYGNFQSIALKDGIAFQDKLNCILQISLALSELHRFEIIHGNIRTKVIFVDLCSDTNNLKFLLGGFEEDVIGVKSKRCNPFILSHLRMLAPEIFQTLCFTKETDVYAFGVTLWEIFTGRKHCNGEAARNIVHNAFLGDLKRFEYDEAVPTRIIDLIKQCCKVDNAKRPTMNGIWMTLSQFHHQFSKKKHEQ